MNDRYVEFQKYIIIIDDSTESNGSNNNKKNYNKYETGILLSISPTFKFGVY